MDISSYIQDKHIEGALAERLQSLHGDDLQAVETLLEAVSPSANTLRGFLQLAGEVAARDSSSIGRVLSDPALQEAAQREGVSRKERQKLVRSKLEALRYPMVATLQARLDKSASAIRKECGLRVELPKDLEGDSIRVQVSARSAEELRELAKKFEKAAENPAAEELFAVLRGEY